MSSTPTSFIILVLLFWTCHSWTSVGGSSGYRRILHEPFIPRSSLPPAAAPTSSSLHSQPRNQQPKRPSSNSNSSTTTTDADAAGGNSNKPFFPSVSTPSWPPPPPHSVVATFPANISSLVVPESPSSRKTSSTKFVAVAAAVVSAIALSVVALVLYYRPQRKSSGTGKGPWSDSLRFHLTDASTSDGLAVVAAAANSSELPMNLLAGGDGGSKLGSPEIRPLPPLLPLPQHNLRITRSGSPTTNDEEEEEHEEEDEFFSPRGSLGGGGRDGSSPSVSFHAIETLNFASISPSGSSNFVSPDRSPRGNPSPLISSSPRSLNSESSDSAIIFSAPLLPPPLFLSPSPPSSLPAKSNPTPPPPRPPPPPPPRFWEERVAPAVVREPNSGPPALVAPSRPIVVPPARQLQRSGSVERTEDTPKPKLKPLHWDKVRASSDRAMVWDQLNSSSFQVNEEMIETLFVVNGSNLNQKDCHWRPAVVSMVNQENRVLDPKKSQNIAILLRALNVTIDEVCEALLEGNADALGSELLESLLKMAPTKVEEHKLKEYNDQSPFKLGPAEKFLKAVIDIPFAFKRVDSMLYIANFDSEVEYLGRAFETLEAACVELRNSKMFLKLLEAVLKTGNRMNVGTIRGDAQAFKLDTLLKLVDIKGTDGKTTLLHFVVQEIIRSEGSRLSGAKHNENQSNDKPRQYDLRDDVEFRKLGLQVVSSLSGELSSIKKAAAMDSDVLSSDVAALAGGISKVREVRELNEHAVMEGRQRFSEAMSGFLKKAEEEILRIQAQETTALSIVREITEYFHGSSAREEAHPFRIFMVVRDFLSILDHVCKEVRRINERTIVSSGRQLPQFGYPTVPPVFPGFSGRHHGGSSDEEEDTSSASAS